MNHNYVEFEIRNIQPAIDFYSNDLPNVNVVDEELHRWKSRWLQIPADKRPQTLSKSLKFMLSPNPFKHLYPFEALCHTPSQFMFV